MNRSRIRPTATGGDRGRQLAINVWAVVALIRHHRLSTDIRSWKEEIYGVIATHPSLSISVTSATIGITEGAEVQNDDSREREGMVGIGVGAAAVGGEERSDGPATAEAAEGPTAPDPELVAKPTRR